MSRDVLDEIYKLYVRPHLGYGDIIYHKYDPEFKLDFTKNLESTQYSAAVAVSGAWRGTDADKLYEELGWEILYLPQERTFHYSLQGSIYDFLFGGGGGGGEVDPEKNFRPYFRQFSDW